MKLHEYLIITERFKQLFDALIARLTKLCKNLRIAFLSFTGLIRVSKHRIY